MNGSAAGREKGPVPFPPPAVYIGGLLLGIAAETLWPTDDPVPAVTITGSAVLIVLAILLDGSASELFVKNKTPMPPWRPATTLVTDGPYRHTRNPMYVGMACLYAGLALAFGLLWALLLLPVVIVVIDRTVIAREEPYLEEKFGDAYRSYKTTVRRWI